MSKKLRRKAIYVIAVEIICLILFGGFLTVMQTRLSVKNQYENTSEKIGAIQDIVDSAYASADQTEVSYDEVYQSKADTVAYMAGKDKNFTYTDSYMKRIADMMNVSNVLIIDRTGRTIAKAGATEADFTLTRFNQLRTVFDNGEPSEAFEVTIAGTTRRYYGARIDGMREAVIEHDPEELHEARLETASWESMLSKISVGLHGYTFAVSSQDYTFLYHPNAGLVGQDALNAGIRVESLEDSYYGWLTVNGERLYCGIKYLDAENAYVICAVPEYEITASRNITVGIVLFIFLVVTTIVIFYAFLILNDEENGGDENKEGMVHFGKVLYNKAVGRRILTISVVGILLVLVISFYMQTLFSLSLRSMGNNRQAQEVQETLKKNEADVALLKEQYNRRYLNKCQTAAYILSGNPELRTKEELGELSRVLDVEFATLFDRTGREIISSSTYVNFKVSDNPEDQSYEFRKLLQGVEYVIQDVKEDELSGELRQYIGALIYDTQGNADGFLQIAVVPQKLTAALASTKLSDVLGGIKVSSGGSVFAVNKEDMTFSWYPQDRMIGKKAQEYGMTENEFRDGYCDYITVNNQRYYASATETDTDYIFVAVPENKLNRMRFPVAAASAVASLIALAILFVLLAFQNEKKPAPEGGKEKEAGSMIDVAMPDGRIRKTDAAASRWANSSMKWNEKTPEQQVASVLKGFMSVMALVICVAVLFKDRFFGEDSIFLYVLSGKWERGVNVFAITSSIMIICVVSVLVMVFREILRMMSKTFGARGETVCRLIRNFVKYISVIAMLYYCFALFGVDTGTLLASAGILSLVIGLGAKTLVSDILAGLFIIFEGEFRVGDIVTIGDWRGTVQEIGVRTTKIMDPGQNVKIISNSDVSGVINMTRRNSYTSCDVGIEYGESLERVESILAKELPAIKKRCPAITDGPFYKGVVSLGDNSVNIRITVQCAEADRAQLSRDLNREMKILFDKYDINIPFPQVVLNQPREYIQATESEKRRADAFNQSQKELSKEMKEEEENKG